MTKIINDGFFNRHIVVLKKITPNQCRAKLLYLVLARLNLCSLSLYHILSCILKYINITYNILLIVRWYFIQNIVSFNWWGWNGAKAWPVTMKNDYSIETWVPILWLLHFFFLQKSKMALKKDPWLWKMTAQSRLESFSCD